LPRAKYWFDAVEHRAVEDASFLQTDVGQGGFECLGLDVLVAADLDLGDGRTLAHLDDEHVAVALDAHVVEEAGLIQGADDAAGDIVADGVADLDGQIVEDRAWGDAAQALDPDVRDLEDLRDGQARYARGKGAQQERSPGAMAE